MKKILLLITFLLLCLTSSYGQFGPSSCTGPGFCTTVSATLVDNAGQIWSNAIITAQIVPPFGNPATVLNNGAPLTDAVTTVVANSIGIFTMSLDDNSKITPAGTRWNFTICPNATVANCSQGMVFVTGSTQDLSAVLSSYMIPPTVNTAPNIYRAYNDNEALGGTGTLYWNTINNIMKGCSVGPCPSNPWSTIGNLGVPGNGGYIPFNGGSGAFNADGGLTWNNGTKTFQATNTGSSNFTGINTFNGADTHNGNETYTGNNTHSGTETFTGAINCTIVNVEYCVSPSNPQGWAGADVGAWINSAFSACSNNCRVRIASGTYTYTTTISITSLTQSLEGSGPRSTILVYTGTTEGITIKPNPYSVTEAGVFRGFTIDGNSTGLQNAGIHVINTNEVKFYDVTVRNFTGLTSNLGSGWWLDNQSAEWSERITCVNCFGWGNRKSWRFTQNGGTNSFARFHCIACYVNIESAQIGLSAENGANVYDSTFDISGNIDSGGSPGTLISVDGSSVLQGLFSVRAESDVNGATCIAIASGGSLFGDGTIDCSNSPNTISNSINSGAHFQLRGGRDPLQVTFSNNGIGLWIIPTTVNGQEGLGFNARWDGGNWQCNGDGGSNGCMVVYHIAGGNQLVFSGVGTTGGGNQTVSNATMIANPVLVINSGGTVSIAGGTNAMYRCTVAGTLRIGAYTTVSADCGTAVDTGIRTK